MAEKKKTRGVKKWLKENGYTEEQMQAFWDELIPINKTVEALYDTGYNWDELNLCLIAKLPTEKERTLKALAEAEKKEREEQERKDKEKAEEEYYNEHFEEIIVKKIDSGEKLTERELRTLVFEYEVETEEGNSLRWVKSMFTVVELCGRTFGINWFSGLTECQENEFNEQPYEVEKHEYEKVITVKEWRKKS